MRMLKFMLVSVFALCGADAAQSADPVKIRLSWVAPVTNWASIMLEKKELVTPLGKSYTLEAVRDLLPRERASEVIDLHRRGEARANLRFSARQVRSFLHAFAGRASLSHALLYRACASMMEAARAAL